MLKLHLIKEPRSLILSTEEYCLVFRQSSSNSTIVDFLTLDEVDLSEAIVLYDGKRISGVLGLLNIGGDTFLTVITSANTLGSNNRTFSGIGTESISVILAVEFSCLTSNTYDSLNSFDSTVDSYDDSASISRGTNDPIEHPCAGIRRILSNGHFYFSSTGDEATDLSTRLERRLERESLKGKSKEEDNEEEEEYDTRFLWNTFLISSLLSFRASLTPSIRQTFDRQSFLALAIQGYAGVYDLNLGGEPAVLSVISRLSRDRAGTRFNVRGIDSDGNTANFVETETILRTPSMCFSYVQIRGSVPIFWEETGLPFGLKITVTQPIQSSLPAFLKHFETLLDNYSSLHLLNLLSSKDQEVLLTESYQSHLAAAKLVDEEMKEKIFMTNFDFHARSRMGIETIKSQLAQTVGQIEGELGSTLISIDNQGNPTLIMGQRGVFRTNCKDCLDRTNMVQDILSKFALEDYVKNANPHWLGSDASLWNAHRVLFADNGDALSKMYVGTGALNTSFSRSGKKSFAGLLADASKSVGRMYQSTFLDGSKQTSIDALLGQLSTSQKVYVFNPLNDALRLQLKSKSEEFTTSKTVSIFVGTWNLNGKGPSSESILPWLFPISQEEEPEIIILGFQELVPLTPQMIVATDPEKKKKWEQNILATLSKRPNKKSDYILLRSGQLVGTALILLVKNTVIKEVKNVEVGTKKTGLRGMAGNKGAVAIRFDYCDTSFCFLTAHLAAGHSNIDERNSDYFTIAEGLHFSKGKTIASHDNVVWASDTNYRISLPNDEVRRLALEDDYTSLSEGDQLLQSMKTKGIFAGFEEGPLLFRPTYKYDNGTQTYDSSEKQRIPAWTDRILYSGRDLDLTRYNRSELLASDHRPVYAILKARIKIIDQTKKAALRKVLQSNLKIDPIENLAIESKLSLSITVSALPPPSDDTQAWYDEAGSPPLIDLKRRNLSINNPFEEGYISPPKPYQPRSARIPPPQVSNTTRAVPPPPSRSTSIESSSQPPPIPKRPTSVKESTTNTSSNEVGLLDEEIDEGNLKSWEVIKA